MTLALLDDTLAVAAIVAPYPPLVEGTEANEFVVTYSMWQRVLDAIAKSRLDPSAPKGQHLRRLVGLEHLATSLDPNRLRIVNPITNQWPAAVRKAQKPWSNALRADWATTAEAVVAAGGVVLLSSSQGRGLMPLRPDARIAEPQLVGHELRFRLQ